MIWLPGVAQLAQAAPTAPPELADAATEAAGVIRACRQARQHGAPCADRTTLAEAAVVQALASLVNDGELDHQASVDAWALDPAVARGWVELIGHPSGAPSPWVRHALAPKAPPEPEVPPSDVHAAPPPPAEPVNTAPLGRSRWWSAAITGSLGLHETRALVHEQQHLRLRLAGSSGTLTGVFRAQLGRTRLDLGDFLLPADPDDPGATRFAIPEGHLYVGAGYGGGRVHTFQVVLGPLVGRSGFGRSTRDALYRVGVTPSGSTTELGAELVGRGRLEFGRVAGVLQVRSALVHAWTGASSSLCGLDTVFDPDPGATDGPYVDNALTSELQVRLHAGLWWTVGTEVQGRTKLGAQPPRFFDTASLQSGLQWR